MTARHEIETLESRILFTTYYVDVNAPGVVQDGTSWGAAYIDLQSALGASVADDEIRVANGTYKPTGTTDRTVSFVIKSGVRVIGGYAGYAAPAPDERNHNLYETILSGDIGTLGDVSDNTFHVVSIGNAAATTLLDGFTITRGNANYDAGGSTGAGLVAGFTRMTVSNCVFTENTCQGSGGGMSAMGPLNVIGCTFIGNSATGEGGGAYVYRGTMQDCTFSDNSSLMGGGLFCDKESQLIRCTFIRNTAESGGGFYSNYGNGLESCVFYGNAATYGGGMFDAYGLSTPSTLMNCIFVGNLGGGFMQYVAKTRFFNCSVVANQAGGLLGALGLDLTNGIVWGNTASVGAPGLGWKNVTFSNIEGGFAGTGNINSDPKFVRDPDPGGDLTWGTIDDDYGDLRLQADSPSLDSGSNASVPTGITLDLAGNDRFSDIPGVRDPGAIVDMGAYERVGVFGVTQSILNPNGSGPTPVLTFSTTMANGSFDAADLIVKVVNPDGSLGGAVPVLGHSYDPLTRAVSYLLPATMADGNYRATLPAGSVTDSSGIPLAADHWFDFHILAGDSNRDRVVDARDLYILSQNWLGTGKTFSQGDFTYDGVVDQADLTLMAQRWQVKVDAPAVPASPAPASPTGAGRRAPVRTPVRMIGLVG